MGKGPLEPAAKRAKVQDAAGPSSGSGGGGPAAMEAEEEQRRDPWKQPCAEAFRFHLVESCTEQELQAEIARGGHEFDAEFFHQHFGDEEIVKGYRGLEVHLWFSASTYHAWVDVSFKQKKMGADQIVKVLSEHFPAGLHKRQQDFVAAVVGSAAQLAACLAPPGPHQGATMHSLPPAGGRPAVTIQHYKLMQAPKEVQELHARFEPLLLFFIDGASLIEMDEKWEVLLAWQQPMEDASRPPLLMGLTTLYNFWAYPDASRLRLSQILVLPPYRELGLGKAMLAVSYRMARERHCIDLTIEDPTPNLQRVREKLEVEQARERCPWLLEQAKACADAAATGALDQWPQRPLPAPTPPPALTTAPPPAAPRAPSEAPSADLLNAPPAAAAAAAALGGPRGSSTSPGSSTAANNNNPPGGKSSTVGAPPAPAPTAAKEAFGAPACLSPTPALLAAMTQELKVYAREARLVWEALLFLQPGLWESPQGRQALEALVRARLEAANFAHGAAEADRKLLVPLSRDKAKHDDNFIMCRVKQQVIDAQQQQQQQEQQQQQQEAQGGGGAGTSGGGGGKAVASGRLTVTLVSAEEKEERLGEMLDERWEQLKTLRSLLARKPQPAK